jgi:hypothetical protein
MQLVAVSPEHLVWYEGHWKWSEFSQVKTKAAIQSDLFLFARKLFVALPWEYTRHTMPRLLESLRAVNGELFEMLRELYEIAHETSPERALVKGNSEKYLKRMLAKKKPIPFDGEVKRGRNILQSKWAEKLNTLRYECRFQQPAPKEGMMLLAGFAKPTYAD